MSKNSVQTWRLKRLSALVDQQFHGSKLAAGRALGYASDAYVQLMLAGERPISEKTVAAIEALPGLTGWMTECTTPVMFGDLVATLTHLGGLLADIDPTTRAMMAPGLHRIAIDPNAAVTIAAQVQALINAAGKVSKAVGATIIAAPSQMLAEQMRVIVNELLDQKGLLLKAGTAVDPATRADYPNISTLAQWEKKAPTIEPADFVPLHLELRSHVGTALLCHHIGRQPQTARGWACAGTYPPDLRPIRVNGRLAWPVAGIRKQLGFAK